MTSRILRLLIPSVRQVQLGGIQNSTSRVHTFISKRHDLLNVVSYSPINMQIRNYAKAKDKRKADKGKGHKVEINEAVMSEVMNVDKMKSDMEHALNRMKEDYMKNLSLRSSTGSIENLKINFEGETYTLMELAQINRKNPKTVIINMASFPQVIPTAIKAITSSGMNLNPQQDGTNIYIPVPKVTKEHRQNLAKNAKSLYIKCRDNIKDVQNKFVKNLKNKEKDGISEDLIFEISEQIIYIANQYIHEAEKMMENKQAELLSEI